MVNRNDFYNGNASIKKAGIQQSFTAEQVTEYVKCQNDVIYFIKNYCKIVSLDEGLVLFELRDYQERMIRAYDENRFNITLTSRQIGKDLVYGTKLPTPEGWINIEDIQIGDSVYGDDGKPTTVIKTEDFSQKNDIFEFRFDNGDSLKSSSTHLWTVNHNSWKEPKTLETKDVIKEHEKHKKQAKSGAIYIDITQPVEFEEKVLPIDPYTLGMWLGDGHSDSGRISGNGSDLIDILSNVPYKFRTIRKDNRSNDCYRVTVDGLYNDLLQNILIQNKHIPVEYLRSSINQRFELLKGLMDTDGCAYKNGRCEFYQKDYDLVKQVRELISSLGIKSRLNSKIINDETYYTIGFISDVEVFKLKRKLDNQTKAKHHPKNKRIYIHDILHVDELHDTRCIAVDNESHLFLAGETMIPTHNTTVVAAYLIHYLIFNPDKSVAILANKAATSREILSRVQRMLEGLPFFLQPGVKEYNKGSVVFGNGSKVLASATSSDSIRGFTFNCVTGNTKITILDDYGRIFYTNISNANSPKYKYNKDYNLYGECMYYTVYKIINNKNQKEYIGYHQTDDLDDGYMGSGKLIKRAIEKYGIENFSKEYIQIFDNKLDAENLEALLVCEEYVLRDAVYNIALGGNVRTMVGENNPFYGKTHSTKTKEIISNLHKNRNVSEEDDLIINQIRYNSFADCKLKTGYTNNQIIKLLLQDNNGYICNKLQDKLVDKINKINIRKNKNNAASSVRMKTYASRPKSETHKHNISTSLKGKVKSKEWVDKINKNPDKISKTANTHRGMTRSDEAKKNMSLSKLGKTAHNKGKVYCYNPQTLEKKLCTIEEIPDGYIRGFVPKDSIRA